MSAHLKALTATVLGLVLSTALLVGTGCSPKVEVRTGTKVVCSYGEVISDDIHTVKVPAADVGKYSVRTVTRTCDRHTRLESLYAEAQRALAAGDLDVAKKKLIEIVALEAGFGQAAEQLATIASGKTPAPDTTPVAPSNPEGSSTPTAKPGDSDTGVPAESLLSWAPDVITGYTASKATVDPLSIYRQYIPASGAKPLTFVVVAEQFNSNKGALDGLRAQVTGRYTQDKENLTINGHEVYYGTDGRRYAVMGFVKGSIMVALEMSTHAGESPKGLKADLKAALAQLP